MKTIKYKVGSMFGSEKPGTIISAKLVAEDPDSQIALLFHPPSTKYECGCFEFAHKIKNIYNSIDKNLYVNCSETLKTTLKEIFTKSSKKPKTFYSIDQIWKLVGAKGMETPPHSEAKCSFGYFLDKKQAQKRLREIKKQEPKNCIFRVTELEFNDEPR